MNTRMTSLNKLTGGMILGALSLVGMVSCKAGPDIIDENTNKLCTPNLFVELDEPSRRSALATCSPEQQIELYIAWSRATYPANMDYVDVLAENGVKIVPYLVDRIEKNEKLSDDIYKPDFLIILDAVDRLGYYRVSQDKKLMKRINMAIKAMEPSYAKGWAEDIFSEISGRQ